MVPAYIEVFQVPELAVLMIAVTGYIPILLQYYKSRNRWVFAAYTALLTGFAATVIESFVFPQFFNLIEHSVGVMGAGILFLICAYSSSTPIVNQFTEPGDRA